MATRTQNAETTGLVNTRTNLEYSRILTAAVINPHFRQLLLSNPGKAIDSGYGGERFHLARDEKTHVASIQATTLADFASQLMRTSGQGVMAVGD
jgi:hypothetical protein